MKTFFTDIIPKIQRYSQKLEDLTKLTNQHWVSINDINRSKRVFIFRQNNQLLISENGVVERGNWEYLGNQSLLIETNQKSYLLKHGFFDENIIALKLDSTENYAFFVNETRYDQELNTITQVLGFLFERYIKNNPKDPYMPQQPSKILISSRLPKPNMWVEQMLASNTQTIINTTINWRQFCDSHSQWYPLYTFQELAKRGVGISPNLKNALNEYANSKEYSSFDKMIYEYFS